MLLKPPSIPCKKSGPKKPYTIQFLDETELKVMAYNITHAIQSAHELVPHKNIENVILEGEWS